MLRRVSLLLVALGVFFGGVVYANAQGEMFTGCLTPGGDLKNVALGDGPAGECKGNSFEVSWNVQGPTGPQGPAGPEGPPGTFDSYVAQQSKTVPVGSIQNVFVACRPGDVAVGGGFKAGPNDFDIPWSRPAQAAGTAIPGEPALGWDVGILLHESPPFTEGILAYAVCLDLTPGD